MLKNLPAAMVVHALVIGPLVASAQTGAIPSTPELIQARDMIGMDVRSELDKTIGVVENLLIEPNTGRVDEVVVRTGGVFGVGGKLVVVPWRDLNIALARDGTKLVATMIEARLEAAPLYERNISALEHHQLVGVARRSR